MIDRLRNRFYMTGETLLNNLINKINKLKIIDNEYLIYINELKSLYEQHDEKCKKLHKSLMGNKIKIKKAGKKLLKIGLQLNYKSFKELYINITESYDFKESCNRNNNQSDSDNENKINYISNKSKGKRVKENIIESKGCSKFK